MREIDEPIRITCERCVFYGKECRGEICVLMEMLKGSGKGGTNERSDTEAD